VGQQLLQQHCWQRWSPGFKLYVQQDIYVPAIVPRETTCEKLFVYNSLKQMQVHVLHKNPIYGLQFRS